MNNSSFYTSTDPKGEADKHELVRDEEQEHNIADGIEFLDEALRMKEQPLGYTEEKP